MRYLGKSTLLLGALAITLVIGAPLMAEENHGHDHSAAVQKDEKGDTHCDKHKGAKDHEAKAKAGCRHHAGKEAKDGDKPCADHAGCAKGGDSAAKADDKASCCDGSDCCKDGAACCEGDGKACAEHEKAHAR